MSTNTNTSLSESDLKRIEETRADAYKKAKAAQRQLKEYYNIDLDPEDKKEDRELLWQACKVRSCIVQHLRFARSYNGMRHIDMLNAAGYLHVVEDGLK